MDEAMCTYVARNMQNFAKVEANTKGLCVRSVSNAAENVVSRGKSVRNNFTVILPAIYILARYVQ
jgi:hypothetical protein